MLTNLSRSILTNRLLMLAVLALLPLASAAQTPDPDSPAGQLRAIATPLGSAQGAAAISALVNLEVSTALLGTSTGGFTYSFDPQLRVERRSASSFGPAFSERVLTTGRGKVSAGVNLLMTGYDSFNDQNLTDGEFRPGRNIQGLPISYSSLELDLSSKTVVGFAHMGVTDDFDLGFAVPWISVSMEAEGGFFTAQDDQLAAFDIPDITSSGIGDVAVFGKYRFLRREGGGAAAGFELRLPTGDRDSFRGLDVTRVLFTGIWSATAGRLSPHANFGYEFWSDQVNISEDETIFAKDLVKYAFGVEIEANPQTTIVIDLVGRYLRHGGKVGYETFPGPGGTSIDALIGLPEGVGQLSLAPGVKWNFYRSALLTVNLLTSLSNSGLRANFTPVFGIDWAFD